MTMEVDSLLSGKPMRSGLDPCTNCAEWQVMRCQVDSLRDALAKVLDTREKEAAATLSYQVALDNYGPEGRAREASNQMRAMQAASTAEREARLLLATLKTPNTSSEGKTSCQ